MKLFLLLVWLSYASNFFPQELTSENITAGITLKYIIPTGDMGEFWENSAGIGMLLGYSLKTPFSLEGEVLYAKFNSKNKLNIYPSIHFLEFSGGIKYNVRLIEDVHLNIKTGIESDMFIFSGEAAEIIYEENRNESEFGFFLLSGLQFNIGKGIKLELSFKVLGILSSPESINMFIPGITVLIL